MMNHYFLQSLKHLRYYEEVMLYNNVPAASGQEDAEVIAWLENEYANEVLNYPYTAPLFNADAGLWAAKTVYTAAQLMLYRENRIEDLWALLPLYNGYITAAAILSADITMRFMPGIIKQLKLLDPADALITILETHLQAWHYSGVTYPLQAAKMSFNIVESDECLYQLYADRIVENKNTQMAKQPAFKEKIQAALGMYAATFWKNFEQELMLSHE